MKNKTASLSIHKVLPILVVLFIGVTFLYARYQYIVFFLAMLASLGALIYLCEKSFGYPIPMIYELKNRTITEARRNIGFLISNTTQEIIIVSGTLSHRIYGYKEILNLFKDLSEQIKSGNITLTVYVIGKAIDPKSVRFVQFLREVAVPIRRIDFGEREKIKHFIVVDSKHVRLEENHKPNDANRKAVLRLNTPYLAGKVKRILNDIVKASTVETLDPNIVINQMTGAE